MLLQSYLDTISQKTMRVYNLFAVSGILFNHESPLRGRIYNEKITKD